MIRTTLLAGLAGLAMAGSAVAEETAATAPVQAASLHQGPFDMAAYYTTLEGEAFEVVATFRERDALAKPMRVVMRLEDGDSVGFSLPGEPSTLYHFSREAGAVEFSAEPAMQVYASAL